MSDTAPDPRPPALSPALTVSAFLTLVLGLSAGVEPVAAQEVVWRIDSVVMRDHTGEFLALTVTANLVKGWHLYSITQPEGGPIATSFTTTNPKEWRVEGPVTAPAFRLLPSQGTLSQQVYDGSPRFHFGLKRLVAGSPLPTLQVRFQVCSDRVCNPPSVKEFTIISALLKRKPS